MLYFYLLTLFVSCTLATPLRGDREDLIECPRDSPRLYSKKGSEYSREPPKSVVEYEPMEDDYYSEPPPPPPPPIMDAEEVEYKLVPKRPSSKRFRSSRRDRYEPVYENKIPRRSSSRPSFRAPRPPPVAEPEIAYEQEPAAESEGEQLSEVVYNKEKEMEPVEPAPTSTFERIPSRPRKMHYKRLFAQPDSPSRREYEEDDKYERYEKYERPMSSPSRPSSRPVSCNEDDGAYESTECDCD